MATITQQSLTMLTAAEVKSLSNAVQINLAEDETLIYKYRDEFLHIQRAAEQGLTDLEMLLENPTEFSIIATAWGFTTTVRDQYRTNLQYRKNLGELNTVTLISNVIVNWLKPKTPTVDVAYYREKGNLVSLLDSTVFIPKLDKLKLDLGVSNRGYQVEEEVVKAKQVAAPAAVTTTVTKKLDAGLSANTGFSTVTTVIETPVVVAPTVKPNYQENFGWEGTYYLKYTGKGRGAYFQVVASSANGRGLPYRFYLGNNRPQGATGLGSIGYSVGETITILGSVMRGGPANNAVITVQTVNSAGAILSATISGMTADGFVNSGRYIAPDPSDPTSNI